MMTQAKFSYGTVQALLRDVQPQDLIRTLISVSEGNECEDPDGVALSCLDAREEMLKLPVSNLDLWIDVQDHGDEFNVVLRSQAGCILSLWEYLWEPLLLARVTSVYDKPPTAAYILWELTELGFTNEERAKCLREEQEHAQSLLEEWQE